MVGVRKHGGAADAGLFATHKLPLPRNLEVDRDLDLVVARALDLRLCFQDELGRIALRSRVALHGGHVG